ncbi:MAG: hypothetical protein MR890_00285 [Akkermansia muciniphila]|nr:hypothetical protein [Akkermansia muciniphila]
MTSNEMTLEWRRLADLPDAEGFAGSYAGVCGGALVVCGGANFPERPLWEGGPKRWTDRVFVMQPGAAGWQDAAPLPKPLGYGATATLPEGMMLIGGSNTGGAVADCYLLTFEDGELQCRPLPPLPTTLTGHAAAVMGGKVYVQGGSVAPGEQDAESRMWIYDPAAATWTEGEPLPGRGRFLHQMATVGNTLYVLGGIGLQPGENGRMVRDMLTEAWSYTPATGWRRLAYLPHFCAAAPTPAPVIDGKIYLLGGDDATVKGFTPQNHPGFHNQSLCYNIARNTWEDAGPVAAARAVLPCAFWGGMAVIVNGEQRPGKRSNQVWGAKIK